MKTIKGDLVLTKDMVFKESIKVEGNIRCEGGRFDLKVVGDITCWDVNCGNVSCGNIRCWDINCGNITCWDIDCWNINCWNIDCGDMVCVSRKKKHKNAKTIAYSIVLDRFNGERKEVMPQGKGKVKA